MTGSKMILHNGTTNHFTAIFFHEKVLRLKHNSKNNLDNSINFNCYDIDHNLINDDLFQKGVSFILYLK